MNAASRRAHLGSRKRIVANQHRSNVAGADGWIQLEQKCDGDDDGDDEAGLRKRLISTPHSFNAVGVYAFQS